MSLILPTSIGPKFGESIYRLSFNLLEKINEHFSNENGLLEVEASHCNFLTPLVIAPLAVLNNRLNKNEVRFKVTMEGNGNFCEYAKLIHFPGGLKLEATDEDYNDVLAFYNNKTYVPIISFPAQITENANGVRESTIQALNDLLNRQLGLAANFRTGLSYLIVELVNNIKDHSLADRGFIFAQYYGAGKYLDLCIIDDGIGILESFHKHGISNYTTHSQALNGAVSGVSTKNQLGLGGRGFGINTSLRMLVDGMKGNFFMISGNAQLIRNPGVQDIIEVPDSHGWQGTLVGLRIPFTDQDFDYAAYLE